MATCHPVLADGKDEVGVGGTVHDHYKNIIVQQNPVQVQICKNVTTSGDKTGDALGGAIIGGILGKALTGNDDGAKMGALFGSIVGHSESNATGGTKRVCGTEIRYNEEKRSVYSYSIIEFWIGGKRYSVKFKR